MSSLYTKAQFAEMKVRVDEIADQCGVRVQDAYYAAMIIATPGLVKVKLNRDLRKDD